MATDPTQIVASLIAFYDWTDRVVIEVGAGGGQLIELARSARRVIAVDPDPEAMDRLVARVEAAGLMDKFVFLNETFPFATGTGSAGATGGAPDVVLFEVCLHQMPDPEAALGHARALAGNVVVLEHEPTSPWSFYAAEDERVQAAWRVIERHPIRCRAMFQGIQRFASFAELASRLADQGATSRARIEALRDQTGIAIPMPLGLALL